MPGFAAPSFISRLEVKSKVPYASSFVHRNVCAGDKVKGAKVYVLDMTRTLDSSKKPRARKKGLAGPHMIGLSDK